MKRIGVTILFLVLSLAFIAPLYVKAASCTTVDSDNCPADFPAHCYTISQPGNRAHPGTRYNSYCCLTPDQCVSPPPNADPAVASEYNPCKFVSDSTLKSECEACAGTWTAIGCITTNPDDLLGTILRIGLGLAGGIAFLLILFGGLQIMTSAGNPEQLNAGRELISSAIVGLILILFSVFLLQFIGITIIGIPGFSAK